MDRSGTVCEEQPERPSGDVGRRNGSFFSALERYRGLNQRRTVGGPLRSASRARCTLGLHEKVSSSCKLESCGAYLHHTAPEGHRQV